MSYVRQARRDYPYRRAPSADGTFAAEPMVALLRAAVKELQVEAVGTVAVSSVWHSLLAVDADDRPVSRVFTWESLIPPTCLDTLADRLDINDYRDRTGSYIHSSYPLSAYWLLYLRGIIAARWTDLPSWLLRQALGVRVGWSQSIASGSGMWNQGLATWDTTTCAAVGLDPAALGDVWREPVDVTTSQGRALGLDGAQLLPVIPDGICTSVGVGAIGPHDAALTAGTSGSVRMLIDDAVDDVPFGLWRYRLGPRRTAIGGAISNAGNLIDWLQRSLDVENPLAFGSGRPPRFTGLIAVPDLAGQRGPRYPRTSAAAVAGIRSHHSRADLASELILSALAIFGELTELMVQAQPELDAFVASGGVLTGTPLFGQLLADATGRPVSVSTTPEPALRGAALIALEHKGTASDRGDPFLPRPAWTEAIQRRGRESRRLAELIGPGPMEPGPMEPGLIEPGSIGQDQLGREARDA